MIRTLTAGALAGLLVCVSVATTTTAAQEWDSTSELRERIDALEQQIDRLRSRTGTHGYGCGLAILFGAFCALWAQNTGRNPWSWFFLGAIFSCLTVIVLLVMNADDLAAKAKEREPQPDPGQAEPPEGDRGRDHDA